MTRPWCIVVAALCLAQAGAAENVIELWGPGADPNDPNHYVLGIHYSVDPERRLVLIHQGSNPNIPWYFQAYDDATGAPGTIDSIQIDATGEVGEIHLSVIGDANHPLGGAAYLKRLDLLTGADAPTTIDALDITADFGELGPMLATKADTLTIGNDVLDAIELTDNIGGLTVAGRLLADVTCETLGNTTIGELQAEVVADVLSDVTVGNAQHLSHSGGLFMTGNTSFGGHIHVEGSLADGYISIRRHLLPEGLIEVTGSLMVLDVGFSLFGTAYIGGNLAYCDIGQYLEGDFTVGGELWNLQVYAVTGGTTKVGSLTGIIYNGFWGGVVEAGYIGTLRVGYLFYEGAFDGSLKAGDIGALIVRAPVRGTIEVLNSLTGSVQLGQELADDPTNPLSGGHILIRRSMMAGAVIAIGGTFEINTEFIAARYTGWDAGETGLAIDPNASVTINGQTYHGDTPAVNLRGITRCKGDMSNNEIVDFDDINWFVEALTDARAFSIAHPGLGGTSENYVAGGMLFHGDCNCDGLLDFDDINGLVGFLGTCEPGCPQGQEDGPPQNLTAAQLAAGLRGHVAAALRPMLCNIVAAVAEHATNPAKRAYWQAVRQHLGE